MTNEELCLQIQQGHEDLIPKLWKQCFSFISMMAGKYVEKYPQLDDTAKDDCIQEAYFCMMDAIRLYNHQEAGFIYYLSYHLLNGFKKACFGGKTIKCLMDPLNNAGSIDAQIVNIDGEGFTLAELIAEAEQGEQAEYSIHPDMAELEDRDYWQSVNGFMHGAFNESSDEVGKAIYHFMLDNDCGFRDAIIGLYGKDALQNRELMNRLESSRRKAKGDFIKYWNSHKGKEQRKKLALDDAIFRNGLRSYGLKHFIEANYTSLVEQMVINRLANK